MCLLVAMVAATLGFWNPNRTATALERLTDPFGSHPWPTKTKIEVLLPTKTPARIPKGETFELRFAVGGELPDTAIADFRVSGGEEFQEVYPLSKADPTALPPELKGKGGPFALVSARPSNRLPATSTSSKDAAT